MKVTKIKKAEIKLEEQQFNTMPGREKIEELLIHHLGQNHISKFEIVDCQEFLFWENKNDTLVIAFKAEDIWRFGADASMHFAIKLAKFREECGADEFTTQQVGRQTIMRFWWD